MTFTEWFIFFLIVQVLHFLGTWKLYVKAGRKAWEAAVPIYNAVILMKIINRPWWWTILLFVPVINVIMIPIVWVETIRSFGRNSTQDTILVLVTLGFYIFYVNYFLDVTYIQDRSLRPRTTAGEWVSSILFAVVAATIVHTYFMQPYTIPTGSLEKTLLIGDFLFVSKFHYGARAPMTAVSFPMVHDSLPLVKRKSYLKWPQIPYLRLPGVQDIKRNDIVVFSWPADTVVQFFRKDKGVIKPIDKKSNYVKRCVGISGDTLSIVNGYVHINGTKTVLPDRAKPLFDHLVIYKNNITKESLKFQGKLSQRVGQRVFKVQNTNLENPKTQEVISRIPTLFSVKTDDQYTYYSGYNIPPKVKGFLKAEPADNMQLFNLTEGEAKELTGKYGIQRIEKYSVVEKNSNIFPQAANLQGSVDNFGPIYIPKRGTTTKLTSENALLYKRIIEVYEGREIGIKNKLTVQGTQVLLNGKPISSYTFQKDYFWMMGDNRHNSEDSRYWGFVPDNHIVGKPVFIFFSKDANKSGFDAIRWDRMFTTVGGSGEPRSYLWVFFVLLAGYIGFTFYRSRKKS